jgi:hypothetical protein
MLRRSNCLPFLVLASFTIILLLSCSQSEDIVTPISTTEIALTAERLPTTPAGMAYELWVAKSSDTVAVGEFLYDGDAMTFKDLSGVERSNAFTLKGDIMSYSHVFVSIERIGDEMPTSPGPIMLIDSITNPDDNPIRLRFPEADSLWLSTAKFNFETPTDLNRYSGLGHGLWFTRYQLQNKVLPDTTLMVWGTVDSTVEDSARFPFTYPCSVTDTSYETVPVNFGGSEFLWMGSTLPTHRGVTFKVWYAVDSTPPFSGKVLTARFTVQPDSFFIDWFNQDGFILPNVSQYGWHYKGWVVTPYNQTGMTSKWRFTKPAFPYNTAFQTLIPGDTGVLFTTGSFTEMHAPDDGNPYSLVWPTPPYPGEDFLDPTALTATWGISSVNFLPLPSGNSGTVFITLEPNNYLYDTTNFPLIAMMAQVPSDPGDIEGRTVQLDMNNWTASVAGNTIGFPAVAVSINRR